MNKKVTMSNFVNNKPSSSKEHKSGANDSSDISCRLRILEENLSAIQQDINSFKTSLTEAERRLSCIYYYVEDGNLRGRCTSCYPKCSIL